MLSRLLLALAIIASVLVFPRQALANYTIAQESGPDQSGSYVTIGQSFTTIRAGYISQIDVYLGEMLGRASELRIYEGAQQPDDPAQALYSQAFTSDCSYCWYSITLASPLLVSANAVYTFDVKDVNLYYSTANPYDGGTAWQEQVPYTNIDIAFRVIVAESTVYLPSIAKQ